MRNKTYYLFLILLITVGCQRQRSIQLFTIGDSTMANKKAEVYPETGWGQVLGEYFDDDVTVHNHARNGRSSKSFIEEGRWKAVKDSLQPGDYVFIQFGHNDEKEYDSTRYTTPYGTYSDNLAKFVNESRAKGAIPVLFTPIVRRHFDDNGTLINSHGDYPDAVRQLAARMKVPLVDLANLTRHLVDSLGPEESKKLYLWTNPDERYPEGRKDNTHLNVEGAHKVAELAAEAVRKLPLKLAKHMKNIQQSN
jgi:lysophospholipase L1-like esterase